MKRWKWIATGILFLVGCSLTIPNVEICVDEGQFGAFCQYTGNASMTRTLTPAQWLSIRQQEPQFCMASAGLGTYNSFVSDQCSITQFNKNPIIWCQNENPAQQLQPRLFRKNQLRMKRLQTASYQRRRLSVASPQDLTSVTVPNIQICADELTHGAFCQFTVSGASMQLTQTQWDQLRFGMFCMGATALAEYQKFIEDSCNDNKDCIQQTTATIRALNHLRTHQKKIRLRMGFKKVAHVIAPRSRRTENTFEFYPRNR